MAVPAHLTIQTDRLRFDSLLSDWRWLVSPDYTPVLMTAFGDLFLRDRICSQLLQSPVVAAAVAVLGRCHNYHRK